MRTVLEAADGASWEPPAGLTPARERILREIAAARGRNGEARITQRELARRAEVTLVTANKAVRALVQAGVLLKRIEAGTGGPCVYRLPTTGWGPK